MLGSEPCHGHKPASSGTAGNSGYMPRTSCSRCHCAQHKRGVKAWGGARELTSTSGSRAPQIVKPICAHDALKGSISAHAAAG